MRALIHRPGRPVLKRLPQVRIALVIAVLIVFAVLGGSLVRAGADAPDPNPALQLHFNTVAVDGTTPDSSPNGLTAHVTAPLQAGRWDDALYISNDGEGVRVNDNDALKPDTLTLVAWVNRVGTPGANRIIVGKQGRIPNSDEVPCAGYSYGLITGPNGGLRFTLRTDQGTEVESETPELSPTTAWDGNWHMIAGTWNGSSMQLWLDGQAQGQPTSVGSFPILQGDGDTYPAALIGGYADHGAVTSCDASGARYTGGLDEIRLYPRVLSGDELAYLARADLTSPPDLANPQPPPVVTTTTQSSTTTTTAPPPPPPGPPHTRIALVPEMPNAQGYYDSSVQAQVTSTPAEAGGSVEVRCVLDPLSVPTSFADLPAGCPYESPTAITRLGPHDLYAAGRDAGGSTETTIAHSHFQIDTAPDTRILTGPSGNVWSQIVHFTFAASERGSRFECQIDRAPFRGCRPTYTIRALAAGPHDFAVRAISPGGITDPTPAVQFFHVSVPTEYSPTCTVTRVAVAFITGGSNQFACEIGTLTGACPAGTVCVDRSVRCPVGAHCTVTTTATWFDVDDQINWGATAHAGEGAFLPPEVLGGFPDIITSPPTASMNSSCTTGLNGDRCSTQATAEVVGNLQPLFSGCAANVNPFAGTVLGPSPKLGDGDVRRVECQADWKIGPAGPLDTVPVGQTVQIYAPAAGVLTVSPGKLVVVRRVVAAARTTLRIARTRIRVTHPATVTVPLKLNGAATRLLRRGRRLRLTLRLTFKPISGTQVDATRTVTITAPPKRPKRCKIPRRADRLRHLPRCLTHR